MTEVIHPPEILEREQALEQMRGVFPNPELEIPGIYSNERLVDILGPDTVIDFVGAFFAEMGQNPEFFRMALSDLSDFVTASKQEKGEGDSRWQVWDTQRHMGANHRGEIYREMSEAERLGYEGLFGELVSYHYWGAEQEWLRNLSYQDGDVLPFSELQRLRFELPGLEM